ECVGQYAGSSPCGPAPVANGTEVEVCAYPCRHCYRIPSPEYSAKGITVLEWVYGESWPGAGADTVLGGGRVWASTILRNNIITCVVRQRPALFCPRVIPGASGSLAEEEWCPVPDLHRLASFP